ncbi:VRR-NUC domain-containing protein [Marinobacterium arenosum]|uniref:VRR-NUC domain-containing protein n=1 Tax=Marinobacterium arenosum TaxID=2862496 RepID=UPI001C94D44D|nr:VRR-NUC domain-containing protein [Marinobacterium arenosum]MBY4677909.1 VRR-NUC domain-containing protein [Marinobacterium arenosum]
MDPIDKLPTLPSDYYLHNFRSLVEQTRQRYGDLLTAAEQQLLERFSQCPEPAQMLYIRLICRRGPSFRSDKLSYPEIGELRSAADHLQQQALLSIDPDIDAEILGQLLTAVELRQHFALHKDRKPALISQLRQQQPESRPLRHWLPAEPFEIWQPQGYELLSRLKLLYFGNLHQDLTEFVLRDLGLMRFEPYSLSRPHRQFRERRQLELILLLQQLRQQWQEQPADEAELPLIVDRLIERLEPVSADHEPLPLQSRLLNSLARQIERQGLSEQAIRLYRYSQEAPAREREARLLDVLGQTEQALQLCRQIEQSPWDISEQRFVTGFMPRLQRRLGGPPVRRRAMSYESCQLQLADDGQRVEMQVLAHYQQRGWQGVWCENDLLCGLLGLLCWQQIFADLPGVYSQPFQAAPLDIDSGQFYRRRRALFEQRFAELQHCDLRTELTACWQQKTGTQNPLVRWATLKLELLCEIADRLPRAQLIALLRTLAFDIRHFRAGLPDLMLWRHDDYRMVEVKGPGDSLQESQKRWLEQFQQLGIPYQICHVSWQTG